MLLSMIIQSGVASARDQEHDQDQEQEFNETARA